jgi:hypothetical protein
MRKRIFPQVVLIFALLFAQQAGFVHALSHGWPAETPRAQEISRKSNVPAPDQVPHRTQVCLQCLAPTLSDGAVNAQNPADVVAASSVAPAGWAPLRWSQPSSFPYLARAPPAIA